MCLYFALVLYQAKEGRIIPTRSYILRIDDKNFTNLVNQCIIIKEEKDDNS